MSKCNFVAIDFETATAADRFPCQMGIVVVRGGKIVEKKDYLIKPPENKYSRTCIKIHGITPDKTKDCKEFPELWPEIREYLKCEVVVAHNMDFDFSVLESVLRYYDLDLPPIISLRCTCRLYNGNKLSNVIKALGMELVNHHNAIFDAEMCAKIFIAYLIDEVNPDELIYPEREQRENKRIHFAAFDPNRQLSSDVKQQDLSIVENKNNHFYDKKVVISGVFDQYPVREELALLLKNYGADINTSISRKTNIFIVGMDYGSSKMKKVIELKEEGYDIEILEHLQLYDILDQIQSNQIKSDLTQKLNIYSI
jgi:DNA polymerase-3 subunit epsilon